MKMTRVLATTLAIAPFCAAASAQDTSVSRAELIEQAGSCIAMNDFLSAKGAGGADLAAINAGWRELMASLSADEGAVASAIAGGRGELARLKDDQDRLLIAKGVTVICANRSSLALRQSYALSLAESN